MKNIRYPALLIVIVILLLPLGCNRSCNVFQPEDTLNAVWGSSANDIFAVGVKGIIFHYDGTSWSKMSSGTTKELNAVWGSGPDDVFAAHAEVRGGYSPTMDLDDATVILHYDGTDWSHMESGTTVRALGLWGSGPNDVYAAGYAPSYERFWYEEHPYTEMAETKKAAILHYNGTEWTEVYSATDGMLFDIWGSAPDDIYAVGAARYVVTRTTRGSEGNLLLHYDGSEWTEMDSGTDEVLLDIFGFAPDDVYVTAGNGAILHYDGSKWTEMDNGSSDGLQSIWGSAPDNIFAYPQHYDGSKWRGMYVATDYISDIWGSGPDDVYTVGYGGAITHYNGTKWNWVDY